MTQRGMKEDQMIQVADMMYRVSQTVKQFEYKETKEERRAQLKEFREFIRNNDELKSIKKEVAELCSQFPIYS
jgi:glycine/serine hydroxymethyltransferase